METSKREIVKNLSNKKIVLGNGFDLFCGLRTSYSDFFKSQKDNYKSFEEFINGFIIIDFQTDYHFTLNISDFPDIFENTVWDMVFYLMSKNKDKMEWCNIEDIIKNTFTNVGNIKWENILYVLQNKMTLSRRHKFEYVCAFFLKNKYSIKEITKNKFYDLLYKELIIFEKKFGNYIRNEQTKNGKYVFNAINTLMKFVNNAEEIVSIDTFNYSNISNNEKWCFTKINNINGTVDCPIFGYFSSEIDPLLNEHKFTKSHRKTLTMYENDNVENDDFFENIIIFGHSLNEQDYNYFFPLFDDLKLNNAECKGKIIIAFNIYNLDKKKEIIEVLTKKLIKMIYEYEKACGSTANRLYDRLLHKNRIIFYEINDDVEDIYNFINSNIYNDNTKSPYVFSWED